MFNKLLKSLYHRWRFRSLSIKFLLPITALMIASLLGGALAFTIGTARTRDKLLEQQVALDSEVARKSLSERAAIVSTAANLLAHDPIVADALEEYSPECLANLNSRAVVVRDRFELDLIQIYNSRGEARANLLASDLYRVSSVIALVDYGEPLVCVVEGRPLVLARANLPNDGGAVITGIDLENELHRIVRRKHLVTALGLDIEGARISTVPNFPFEEPSNSTTLRMVLINLLNWGQDKDQHKSDMSLILGKTPLTLLLALKTTGIAEVTNAGLRVMVGSMLITTFLLVATGVVVARSIAQPVHNLADAAQAVAKGNLSHRVELASMAQPFSIGNNDEIGLLANTFNAMVAELEELYEDLEDKVRQRTEELRHRALQLQTSIAVGQRITSILELDVLLNQVAALIKDRFGYTYVGIFLLDETGAYVTAQVGVDEQGKTFHRGGFSVQVDHEDIISQVTERRLPVVVNDKESPKFNIIPQRKNAAARSELALPLKMGSSMLGVLHMQSAQIASFRDDDVPLLQSLADQVAIAIQNASLYKGEKSRRQLAENLYNVGRALSSTLDLDKVLDLLLKYLAQIVPYDRASVMLSNGAELQTVAARGFPPDVDPLQISISIHEGDIFRQIYVTQQPLVIPDVASRPDWQYVDSLPKARVWMGIPLIRYDEVIGMLSLTRELIDDYSEEEVTMAATFAGQAAIALENARLYQEITRFNQELEGMVQERTKELQSAYNKLERLDRTKTDFLTVSAHELRTPLTVIKGYAQMLETHPLLADAQELLSFIKNLLEGTERLNKTVNGMLDVTKIDARSLSVCGTPVKLFEIIEDISLNFKDALKERELTLTISGVDNLSVILADAELLHKAFYHLIVNAIKYTPDGGAITVTGRDLPDAVEIVVSDTGIGIDPGDHELIFEKFYQTGDISLHSSGVTKFKGGGPGLGLAIARGVVEAHDGKLWVESPCHDEGHCPGSSFHVVLPLSLNEAKGEIGENS